MIFEEYENCTLCPRMCNVNRNNNLSGFCRATSALKIGRASLHMGEEPCVSGEHGSGTVFFSGCNLKCCYCQNFSLSRGEEGVETDEGNLCRVFLKLQEQGAHNINLVTGEHFAPHIKKALVNAKEQGLSIPVILNSGGYVSEETLLYLKDVIDIYLVDFKYMDSNLAKKYSSAENYPSVAKKAVERMVSLSGDPVFDSDGMLKKGVIVRHLCLPGNTDDSKRVIKYLHNTYGGRVILSVMNQFTPFGQCEKFPELKKPLSKKEYEKIIDYCIEIGVEDAYIQEGETSSESFIPEFNGEGVVF